MTKPAPLPVLQHLSVSDRHAALVDVVLDARLPYAVRDMASTSLQIELGSTAAREAVQACRATLPRREWRRRPRARGARR